MAMPSNKRSACVLTAGTNDHGSLCLPNHAASPVPTRVLALRSQFSRCIVAGDGWSACGTAGGALLAWGCGELPTPLDLGFEDAPSCASLACGPKHAYLLTDEGGVFSWEYAAAAPLQSPPQRVSLPVDVTQLACGDAHVLALGDGGIVFSWGRGVEGQLGRQPPLPKWEAQPRRVDDQLEPASPAAIVEIACGGAHSVLLTSSGDLYGCGPRALLAKAAKVGAFGGGVQPVPALIDGPWSSETDGVGLIGIACGRAHTLALSDSGRLYSFGENKDGQLGHGAGGPFARPMRAGGSLVSLKVEKVWASPLSDVSFARASAAASENGEARYLMWGKLPGGGGEAWKSPEEVIELRGLDVISMVAGRSHCLALLSAGDVYSWGAASAGEEAADVLVLDGSAPPPPSESGGSSVGGALGLQLLGAVRVPRRQAALDAHRIVMLACGDGPHTLALTAADAGGYVLSWGRNAHGELGVGETEAGGAAPRRIMSGALASRTRPLLHIAAGTKFSLACGAHAGDVVGWGDGSKGQLGIGASAIEWTPRRLPPIGPSEAMVSCLAAGGQHAGAVLTTTMEGMDFDDDDGGGFSLPIGGDGVLWGCGEYGALGRGDVKDHPEAASCDTGSLAGPAITTLALGRACSAAIDTHGAVHVWGRVGTQYALKRACGAAMPAAT